MTYPTYTCLLCGRNRFVMKVPHYCIGGYRKHGIEWKLNNEEMKEEKKRPTIYEDILSQLDLLSNRSRSEINGGNILISPLALDELTFNVSGVRDPKNLQPKIASIISKWGKFDIVEQADWQGVQYGILPNKDGKLKSVPESQNKEEDVKASNPQLIDVCKRFIAGLNDIQDKKSEGIKEKAKQKEEEIQSIAEGFQKECHLVVEASVRGSSSYASYQDATNTWLFYKLAQLSYEIKELKK